MLSAARPLALALCLLCAPSAFCAPESVATNIARAKALSVSGDPQKLREARAIWERLAETNNMSAIVTLGLMLREGIGGPVDLNRSMDLMLSAVRANAGSADASRVVAMYIFNGEGGAPRNALVAYALLALTSEMGAAREDPGTRQRLLPDFERVHTSLTDSQRSQALCLPVSYVQAYTLSKGSARLSDYDRSSKRVKDAVRFSGSAELKCP